MKKKEKFLPQVEPWYGAAERTAIEKYLKSNAWLTEFKETEAFEQAIAQAAGVGHCSIVSNGTVALFLALKALGVGPGDEVIVPDLTMIASPNAVVLAGATPIFVDVDQDSLCINPDAVASKITRKTKVIMHVALNGRAGRLNELKKLCDDRGLPLMEDAAHAFGSTYQGKYLGTHGTLGIYSFTPHKIITTGQGGAIVTNDDKLYQAIEKLKDFGRMQGGADFHDTMGWNFKFPDLLSVFGRVQMRSLDKRIARKKKMYALYEKLLAPIKEVTFIKTDLKEVTPWFIDIFVPDPNALRVHLKNLNIGSRPIYPAIHTQPIYKNSQGSFENSLWAGTHGLWLPSSLTLTTADIKRICSAIAGFYER